MRLLLVTSLLAPLASAFFFATIPNNAYARPPEAGPAPPCNCDPPTFPPLPTFAPLELPTLGPLPTLPPFEWPTLPPAPAQAAAAQGYVQPPKPLELPTLAPLEPLPTMAPLVLPTLPPFELPKAPDTYVQPKPLELPTLPPLESLPTLAPLVLPTFAPLPPAPEYVLPTLPPFEFPKLPEGYVQPPKPVEVPTLAPLVLPTFAPLEPLPTMAPIVLPTLPPLEAPKLPDTYVQPKPLEFPTMAPFEFPTLPPYKAPEPVYVQPLELPTFAPLPPLPTLAPFEWPTFAPLPAGGYATAPPQYVVPPTAPKVTNDIVTETGVVGGVEEAAPLEAAAPLPVEPAEEVKSSVAVDNADASATDEEVAPPPSPPQADEVEGEFRRDQRAPPDCTDFMGYLTSVDCWLDYRVPEGVVRPEIPTGDEPKDASFVQTNVISDGDLAESEHPKTFEDAVVTSNKLRLRRGSSRHLEGIRRISI